jgi:hypothetical protein
LEILRQWLIGRSRAALLSASFLSLVPHARWFRCTPVSYAYVNWIVGPAEVRHLWNWSTYLTPSSRSAKSAPFVVLWLQILYLIACSCNPSLEVKPRFPFLLFYLVPFWWNWFVCVYALMLWSYNRPIFRWFSVFFEFWPNRR